MAWRIVALTRNPTDGNATDTNSGRWRGEFRLKHEASTQPFWLEHQSGLRGEDLPNGAVALPLPRSDASLSLALSLSLSCVGRATGLPSCVWEEAHDGGDEAAPTAASRQTELARQASCVCRAVLPPLVQAAG